MLALTELSGASLVLTALKVPLHVVILAGLANACACMVVGGHMYAPTGNK